VSSGTFALLALIAGVVLLATVVGGLLVLAMAVVSARSRDNESRLDDEYEVARSLGYPMGPVWQARHQNGGGDRPEEPAA
jgi:hypothetical protein